MVVGPSTWDERNVIERDGELDIGQRLSRLRSTEECAVHLEKGIEHSLAIVVGEPSLFGLEDAQLVVVDQHSRGTIFPPPNVGVVWSDGVASILLERHRAVDFVVQFGEGLVALFLGETDVASIASGFVGLRDLRMDPPEHVWCASVWIE